MKKMWTELHTIDGRCLARTSNLTNRWDYARPIVARDADCPEDDVELQEHEMVDWYCVNGKPYARLLDRFDESPEHKQAMEEREVYTSSAAAQMQIAKLEAEVAYLKHEVDVWRGRCDAVEQDFDRAIAEFDRYYSRMAAE
jgi:hypothetical protein